jgi:hypothetical protein
MVYSLSTGDVTMRRIFGLASLATILVFLAQPRPVFVWGDEGHHIVALIAQPFLLPDVRTKVGALLSADPDPLTRHDIAAAATWADKYRDADINHSRLRTRQWHFVDIEITMPNLDAACFNYPAIPPGTSVSNGPADDCLVDKINQFAAELANPRTDFEEQVVALKFLLHFVGDLHQPLHCSDDHDRGGNDKRVSAAGFRSGNLHAFWDTEIIMQFGSDAESIADDLTADISADEQQQWQIGAAADWAMEISKSPSATAMAS